MKPTVWLHPTLFKQVKSVLDGTHKGIASAVVSLAANTSNAPVRLGLALAEGVARAIGADDHDTDDEGYVMISVDLVRRHRPTHTTLSEPGQCSRCDEGWSRLRADARCDDNLKHAWELRPRVKRYVNGHPDCTLDDLYRDLDCCDIPLYICLHLLVHDFQLRGPDPYACGAPDSHMSSTYRVLHLPGPPSE